MQSETVNRDYEYGPAEKRGYILGLQPLQIGALGVMAVSVVFLMLTNHDAEAALELGACRIVNVKVGRVGGFSEARKVHDVCQDNNVPVWCGGMLETGVGRAHNIALSTMQNFRLPGDVSASKRYWAEDIIEPEVEVSAQGAITVSDETGTGYRIREDLIEKLSVRKETF